MVPAKWWFKVFLPKKKQKLHKFFYDEITAILQPEQIIACRKYICKYKFVAFRENRIKGNNNQKNVILFEQSICKTRKKCI